MGEHATVAVTFIARWSRRAASFRLDHDRRRSPARLLLLLCALSALSSAELRAQHVPASRFVVSRAADSVLQVVAHGNVALNPRISFVRESEPRSVARQRAVHTGYGALVGALAGGVFGFIVDQQDRTGEGLIAPVMIGGGAVLGAIPGALVGLLIPVHRQPTT